jgi:WS/DGAT/MGAT family acyltransferase
MPMKQLSGLDATFLHIETPEMPMHVGALHVFELPAGYKGRFVRDLRRHIAARLPVAPVLRRRVWWMPLNLANPAWVDAEPDLSEHIVEVKLPKSAAQGDGMATLQAQVAALHPALLDRSRPLWKFHVLEGLAPAASGHKRVGLYSKLHHAAVDGQAAVALANALFDATPQARAIEVRASKRQKTFQLEMTEMLRGAIANEVAQVVQIVKELPSTAATLGGAARTALGGLKWLGGSGGPSNLTLAPRTPLNVSVTAGRAFAAVTVPLAEAKALARASEATLNDIVLMLCSSALRRYLAKRKALPRKSLVAAVPISLRAAGDTSADNQASMSLVSLGTNLADPRRRLAHVKAAGAAMKRTMGSVRSILPTDFPSIGVPWLMEAAASLYGKAKVADRIPQVANVVISNVPGPTVPLYLAGARMLTNYPTSIVVHGLALNITVQSYDRSLDFGLMADAQAMPDVQELAQGIAIAFDDLRALLHEPDEELSAPALVGRAAKQVTSAVTNAVTGAVTDAVKGALAGAVSGAMSSAVSNAMGAALGRSVSKATPARRAPAPARKGQGR